MSSPKKIHAFRDDALADHDAVALANLLGNKEISQHDVVTAVIERANLLNPQLNAIQLDCFEQAMQQPKHVIHRFFSGVPIFLKDNVDVAGLATQHGSQAVPKRPAKKNSAISDQILDQGFLLLGKSTLPEFGLNASTEYQDGTATRNPWDLAYSCGASSGGSAALVASGVVPIAHANDGGGSIRIPAAACGLVGLKPSRGRIKATDAANSLPINIISEGVLTRSVRDTAYFYAQMEKTFHPTGLASVGLVQHPSSRRLRIALVEQSITGTVDSETQQSLQDSAKLLEQLGHRVDVFQLPLPQSFVDDFSHYWGSLSFLLQHMGKPLFGQAFQANRLDGLTRGLAALYQKNMLKTPLFIYRLKKLQQRYQAIFQHFDVLLSPVLAHTTPKLGYLSPELDFDTLFERIQNYVTFTPVQNVVGAPGISLPMGYSHAKQLPIGMQLSANIGDEKTLLQLAYEIEQAQPWRRIQDA